jgi:aryl sulfotransferase
MADAHPRVLHEYKHWILDSTRWEDFTPRDDDIVIATPYKCGTTWMQLIVGSLIYQERSIHDTLAEVGYHSLSPWLDMARAPVEETLAALEEQERRRFIKTHLPLDGLIFYPEAKYIVVSRDPRDVFMSLWNHHTNWRRARLPEAPPSELDDMHAFWRDWITRGTFQWESEGYPYWSNLRHAQTWWRYYHLPNILFVHFNHLLADLPAEIRRVAAFLDISVADDDLARVAHETTFSTVKRKADTSMPGMEQGFEGGAQTFFHKGTNGRWRNVLSASELALYDDAARRELTPDCRRWLERGEFPEKASIPCT